MLKLTHELGALPELADSLGVKIDERQRARPVEPEPTTRDPFDVVERDKIVVTAYHAERCKRRGLLRFAQDHSLEQYKERLAIARDNA